MIDSLTHKSSGIRYNQGRSPHSARNKGETLELKNGSVSFSIVKNHK